MIPEQFEQAKKIQWDVDKCEKALNAWSDVTTAACLQYIRRSDGTRMSLPHEFTSPEDFNTYRNACIDALIVKRDALIKQFVEL